MSEQISEHNRRALWSDVANNLQVAVQAVDSAQGSLEDLAESGYADQLDEQKDALRRAANDATERASAA